MFETLKNAFKVKEIRRKIWITLLLLLIFRIGSFLPLPGIDIVKVQASFAGSGGTTDILSLLSAITGGALANASFLALGISPYINSSIIIQLLTAAIPKLEQYSKQGEEGRRKIGRLTRIITLILGLIQAIGITISWNNQGYLITNIFGSGISATAQSWLVAIAVVIILVAGASFTMWLGEKITEQGIGNGISLLIFVGILASAGQSIIAQFTTIVKGGDAGTVAVWELVGFIALTLVIFAVIVFFDTSERRVNIQYAKQVKGRKMMGGQSTYIPVKVNACGVMPIIFATALLTFPQVLATMFVSAESDFVIWWQTYLGTNSIAYNCVLPVLIFAFSFFYASIQFNPDEIARNIQQYGGFISGIRPGKPTAEYLKKINRRLTFFGALFLALIALVPNLLFAILLKDSALLNSFTATGMLIIVSVALEFDKQLQSQMMMRNYKGFLK